MPLGSRTDRDGFVAWIEGLPVSGKSTLSIALRERIDGAGFKVEVLDGDQVRQMFSPELGFSRKDREFHARRVSYVARMLARNGVVVLVAMITPYETSRQAARATVGERFTEIWLRCPLAVCQQRDTKGLYAPTGAHGKVTGVDDPFEEPLNPDLVVDTATESVGQSTDRILAHLAARKYLPVLPPRVPAT
jgi:adenylylsulfate kinase